MEQWNLIRRCGMRLLINKYGMKFYTREHNRNAGGEQGETEGLMRYLVSAGHEVYYFGVSKGEVPGVTFITPHLEDLDHESTASHQQRLWDRDVEMIGDLGIEAAIQVNGLAPTFSWIDNPKGARLQAFTVRMCGPWLNILQRLKLPRWCVNNDPRSYPRDQEMSFGWEWARPRAMLDQWSCEKDIIVGGKPYTRRSVYAACESFGYLEHRENTGELPIVIVAHKHAWGTHKWELADRLIREFNCQCYGNGWPAGAVKPYEVFDIFRTAKCTYIDPHTVGFNTGKPYVAVSQGCVPCYTYDEIIRAMNDYEGAIAEARAKYVPNFSHIDRLLDGEYYGGYEPR